MNLLNGPPNIPKDIDEILFYKLSTKKYFNELIILYSDNDDEYIINSAKQVHSRLDGELINLSGKGHFTLGDMGTEEFPELLEKILE